MRGKSRGKHQPLMSINAKKLPGKTASRKEIRLMAVTYAVARNSKPKECAKGAERPWRLLKFLWWLAMALTWRNFPTEPFHSAWSSAILVGYDTAASLSTTPEQERAGEA